jgi:putative acetyltransferase
VSSILVREETPEDHQAIYEVTAAAFEQEDESKLINRIRQTDYFIPALSLVAERSGNVVGHILFSIIEIRGRQNWRSLALAPIAVLPGFQGQGVGSMLVREGLARASRLGYESVIVVGHARYYPRFGFEKASRWGLTTAFKVADESLLALELQPGWLRGKSGRIVYPDLFGLPN